MRPSEPREFVFVVVDPLHREGALFLATDAPDVASALDRHSQVFGAAAVSDNNGHAAAFGAHGMSRLSGPYTGSIPLYQRSAIAGSARTAGARSGQ